MRWQLLQPALRLSKAAVNAHPRPYYYLENFTVALDWLRSRYRELLAAEEQQFMVDFARLPVASAALMVRMTMRQGDLFRATKLNYAEIGCPRQAAAPLSTPKNSRRFMFNSRLRTRHRIGRNRSPGHFPSDEAGAFLCSPRVTSDKTS